MPAQCIVQHSSIGEFDHYMMMPGVSNLPWVPTSSGVTSPTPQNNLRSKKPGVYTSTDSANLWLQWRQRHPSFRCMHVALRDVLITILVRLKRGPQFTITWWRCELHWDRITVSAWSTRPRHACIDLPPSWSTRRRAVRELVAIRYICRIRVKSLRPYIYIYVYIRRRRQSSFAGLYGVRACVCTYRGTRTGTRTPRVHRACVWTMGGHEIRHCVIAKPYKNGLRAVDWPCLAEYVIIDVCIEAGRVRWCRWTETPRVVRYLLFSHIQLLRLTRSSCTARSSGIQSRLQLDGRRRTNGSGTVRLTPGLESGR